MSRHKPQAFGKGLPSIKTRNGAPGRNTEAKKKQMDLYEQQTRQLEEKNPGGWKSEKTKERSTTVRSNPAPEPLQGL